MTEDFIRAPEEFLKLNKDVLLTMDIFFVNKIPFLIILSRKIDFTATSHLPTQKDRDIIKAFWCISVFYLKCDIKITTVHADEEFATVQETIAEMLIGPMVNSASVNDHVTKI